MNSKERVLRAINHQDVDRIPAGLFGTHSDYMDGLAKHIGADSIEQMHRQLGIDIWHCGQNLKDTSPQRIHKGTAVDCWGIPMNLSEEEGYSHTSGAPLAEVSSIDEIEEHLWPNVDDFIDNGLSAEIEAHSEFAVVGGINSAVFHIYSYLCGFDQSLMLLHLEPELAKAIIRKITDFWEGYLRKVLEAGKGRIDIIENCNDFGTQSSLFISPDQFREFFKPALQRLYNVTKEYGAKVMQHSCGAIAPIIPDFIEMGADILNPIQVSSTGMDLEMLVPEYGKQICFYGGIDTQWVLPQGPVDKIKADTRHLIELFGHQGGLILAGSQGLMNDIPFDNALAMLQEPSR